MIVKEYYLKFTQFFRCDLTIVAAFRAYISKFVCGVSEDVVKECRTTMFVKEMDISKLMVHAQ